MQKLMKDINRYISETILSDDDELDNRDIDANVNVVFANYYVTQYISKPSVFGTDFKKFKFALVPIKNAINSDKVCFKLNSPTSVSTNNDTKTWNKNFSIKRYDIKIYDDKKYICLIRYIYNKSDKTVSFKYMYSINIISDTLAHKIEDSISEANKILNE